MKYSRRIIAKILAIMIIISSFLQARYVYAENEDVDELEIIDEVELDNDDLIEEVVEGNEIVENEKEDIEDRVIFETDEFRKYVVTALNREDYRVALSNFEEDPETYHPTVDDMKLFVKFDRLASFDYSIADLKTMKGLEYGENIEELRLFSSKLEDLSFLDEMSSLKNLYLTSPNVEDISPIGNLKGLKLLSINFKGLEDYTPIKNLTFLEELSMNGEGLSDISFLKDLINLKNLSLYENKIDSLEDISGLINLEELIINNNELESLEGIEKLSKIKKLIISYNKLTDIKGVENLKNLEVFECEKNKIRSIEELRGLDELRAVTIRGNLVKDIRPFENADKLTYLHLYENQVEDISSLSRLVNLEELNISKNNIEDASVISNFKELKNLHARENLIRDLDFLVKLIGYGNIETINISENPIIDISQLKDIDKKNLDKNMTALVIDKQRYSLDISLDKNELIKSKDGYLVEIVNPLVLADGSYGKLNEELSDFKFEYKTIDKENDRLVIYLGKDFDKNQARIVYGRFDYPNSAPGYSENWDWTEEGPIKIVSYGSNFDGDIFINIGNISNLNNVDKFKEVNFSNDEFRKYIVASLNNGDFRYNGNPFKEDKETYNPLVYNMNALRELNWRETEGIDYSKIKDLSGLEYSLFLQELDISTGYIEDISHIAPLRKIMNLNLANNKIDSIDLVRNFKNLTYIDISNTDVKDLSPLENLPNLFYINASGCNISKIGNISEFVEIDGVDRDSIENQKGDKREEVDPGKPIEVGGGPSEPKESLEDKRDYIKEEVNENLEKFDDIENYFGKDSIINLQKRNIINGFSDGSFKPNKELSRGEFVVILDRIFKLENKGEELEIKDLEDDWYKDSVHLLAKNNIVFLSNGYYNPRKFITREEMITMLVRAIERFEKLEPSDYLDFEDLDKISNWAEDSISKAYGLNLIKGYNGRLNPKGNITRGELSIIIDRFINSK